MLTLVEIMNARGDTLLLPMTDSSAGYAVEEIDGLDPVNATLTSSSMAQMDGAQFQNAQRGTRNITMKIGLEPDWVTDTVDSLRTNLYSYFMPKSNIQVSLFKDNALFAVTAGQVESFENSMFSADPEVDISIICYDPDLYAPSQDTQSWNSTQDTSVNVISYEGTSDAGISFTLSINTSINGFTLYNTTPDGILQKMDFEGIPMFSGDVVQIVTSQGQKSATLIHNGFSISLMPWMDATATWILLKNGTNNFRVHTATGSVPYEVNYTAKYGGF
jgi:hypothetical protein